jgi:hypothetical protein
MSDVAWLRSGSTTDEDRRAIPGQPTLTSTDTSPAVQQRTRVVLADVVRLRDARRTTTELRQQSQIGDALLRGLIRAQLAHALRVAALLAVGLGSLPLLFAIAPVVAEARPFGVGLPWLLLGLAAYPFLFALGAIYVHLAERTEAEFTDLVERPDR